MKIGLSITIAMILLISCSKNDSNENIEQLKAKFHGKYEVITSFSLDPVDLNMDGISSTNLLSENPEILKAGLEIRIIEDNRHLFEEAWPVEYISIPRGEVFDSTVYHPTYIINYALCLTGRFCKFNDNYESIQLLENFQQNSTNKLIRIESIMIEDNEIIKVSTIRKLYTIKGWITTKIESRYIRYTMIT